MHFSGPLYASVFVLIGRQKKRKISELDCVVAFYSSSEGIRRLSPRSTLDRRRRREPNIETAGEGGSSQAGAVNFISLFWFTDVDTHRRLRLPSRDVCLSPIIRLEFSSRMHSSLSRLSSLKFSHLLRCCSCMRRRHQKRLIIHSGAKRSNRPFIS